MIPFSPKKKKKIFVSLVIKHFTADINNHQRFSLQMMNAYTLPLALSERASFRQP